MNLVEQEIAQKLIRPNEELILKFPEVKQEQFRIGWRIQDALIALWNSRGYPSIHAGRVVQDRNGSSAILKIGEPERIDHFIGSIEGSFGVEALMHKSTWVEEQCPPRDSKLVVADFAIRIDFFRAQDQLLALEELASCFRLRPLGAALQVIFERLSSAPCSTVPESFLQGIPGVGLFSRDRRGVQALHDLVSSRLGVQLSRLELRPDDLYDPSEPTEDLKRVLDAFELRPGDGVIIDGGYFSLPNRYPELIDLAAL